MQLYRPLRSRYGRQSAAIPSQVLDQSQIVGKILFIPFETFASLKMGL